MLLHLASGKILAWQAGGSGFESQPPNFFFKRPTTKKAEKKPYRIVACGVAIWSQSILQVTQNILIFIVLELA